MAFTCQAGAKVISLCGQGEVLRYRYGRPGAVEMSYPAGATPARQAFRYSFRLNPFGGEARVRFTRAGHTYVVFTATLRGPESEPGIRDWVVVNGVAVRKGGRTVANIRCTDDEDHDLQPLAPLLAREAFDGGIETVRNSDFGAG